MITDLFGDCLELLPQIQSGSVDMILSDWPYGQTQNKWDSVIPLEPLWAQCRRVIKPKGIIALFGQGVFTAKVMLAAEDIHRYNMVWHKTNASGHLNAKKMPLRAHEDVMIFYRQPGGTYNPQKTTGHKRKVSTAAHKRNCVKTTNYGDYGLVTYDSTERYPTSILTFKKDVQKDAGHPTQKPVSLLEWLIRTYSNEGDTVLDMTRGRNSTAIACVNTNRHFIGMESDYTEYELGKDRLFKHLLK